MAGNQLTVTLKYKCQMYTEHLSANHLTRTYCDQIPLSLTYVHSADVSNRLLYQFCFLFFLNQANDDTIYDPSFPWPHVQPEI